MANLEREVEELRGLVSSEIAGVLRLVSELDFSTQEQFAQITADLSASVDALAAADASNLALVLQEVADTEQRLLDLITDNAEAIQAQIVAQNGVNADLEAALSNAYSSLSVAILNLQNTADGNLQTEIDQIEEAIRLANVAISSNEMAIDALESYVDEQIAAIDFVNTGTFTTAIANLNDRLNGVVSATNTNTLVLGSVITSLYSTAAGNEGALVLIARDLTSLQNQIDALDTVYATDASVASATMALQEAIDAISFEDDDSAFATTEALNVAIRNLQMQIDATDLGLLIAAQREVAINNDLVMNFEGDSGTVVINGHSFTVELDSAGDFIVYSDTDTFEVTGMDLDALLDQALEFTNSIAGFQNSNLRVVPDLTSGTFTVLGLPGDPNGDYQAFLNRDGVDSQAVFANEDLAERAIILFYGQPNFNMQLANARALAGITIDGRLDAYIGVANTRYPITHTGYDENFIATWRVNDVEGNDLVALLETLIPDPVVVMDQNLYGAGVLVGDLSFGISLPGRPAAMVVGSIVTFTNETTGVSWTYTIEVIPGYSVEVIRVPGVDTDFQAAINGMDRFTISIQN